MTDNLSPEDRMKTMRAVKSKQTRPERRLRALLAAKGVRGWCVNPVNVHGNPDIVFLDSKIALFVDGCFWHGCPVCNRPLPRTNAEYWSKKIARNVERDRKMDHRLVEEGWVVIRLWEHQFKHGQPWEQLVAEVMTVLKLKYRKGQ